MEFMVTFIISLDLMVIIITFTLVHVITFMEDLVMVLTFMDVIMVVTYHSFNVSSSLVVITFMVIMVLNLQHHVKHQYLL